MWRIIANPGSMQQLGDVEETVRSRTRLAGP
jgi:hypothetical protein